MSFFFNFNGLSPPPWLRGADRTKFQRAAILGYRYVAIIYFTDLLRLFRVQDEN